MSQHRTTAAHAVAAVAMTELAGTAASGREQARLPGFAVERPRLASRKPARVSGRAKVSRLRTGEVETMPYQATATGPLTLQCQVGRTHLTLGALPEEAREPIVLALLARLALASRVTGRDCARAIELAGVSGGAGRTIAPALRPAFTDLLRRLLEQERAAEASEETIQVVRALLDAVPEAMHDEARHRTEEWVWLGLATRPRTAPPSPALESLADHLGFERHQGAVRARR